MNTHDLPTTIGAWVILITLAVFGLGVLVSWAFR